MNVNISPERFPSRSSLSRGIWAPVLFAPNPDTPERLVIAVAAIAENGFHVEAADANKKMACLYGPSAATALMVQHASITALREDLATRGQVALEQPQETFSGVSIGAIRVGEAESMEKLARRWLIAISSMHEASSRRSVDTDDSVTTMIEALQSQADNDKLPVLVFRAVEQTAPDLGNYFSADIRSRARKAVRPKPQKVFIGFAGNNVVANFATLKTSRPRQLVDHIKRLMWDLARHRDDEAGQIARQRSHEMIVFRRGEDDPEYDEKKGSELQEIISDLQEQGGKDEILVQSRSSVPSIADHILTVERQTVRV